MLPKDRTVEAMQVSIAASHDILCSMVPALSILSLTDEIARRFHPRKIVLFGSYAYGEPNEDSDVDIMVVMPHERPSHHQATEIRLAAKPTFPMDLLVRSSAELKHGAAQKDWFIVEILEKGIVLHDRANRAVGAEGRSRLRRRLAVAPLAKTE